MTPDLLLSEGHRLARECVYLDPAGDGPVAGLWYSQDEVEGDATGVRRWITVAAKFVPGFPSNDQRFLTVTTDGRDRSGGRVEVRSTPSEAIGIELRASNAVVLPPIEAIFLRGNEQIGAWLAEHDWPRDERYNANFPDSSIVDAYEQAWMDNYPLFRPTGAFAMLGGWHFPNADDDWYDLVDEQLMILTLEQAEPWLEAWRLRSGRYRVIQRVT